MNLQSMNKSGRHIKYFLSIIALIFSISFFNSCSNPHKFYYLKCDTAMVYKWLDTAHYDSTHGIERLILQFYSPDIKHSDNNMEAVVYPLSESGVYYQAHPDTLKKERDTSLVGAVVFGNNVITRQKIIDAITNDSNQRVSFVFLVFQPIIDSASHIRYAIFPTDAFGVPTNQFLQKSPPTSDPCPPAQCY
jgi:hypothetical protein